MTTQRAVEHSALVAQHCPLLANAIALVGHQQTRNRGTIGGSLCHLDPGAELPVVACALGAELNVAGADGGRRLSFHDFADGYLTTQLAADEVLTSVDWPKAPARTGVAFLEFNRRPADFAIVSAAVQISLRADGAIARAWLALGGVQSTPLRLGQAESALEGVAPAAIPSHWGHAIAAEIECDGDALYPPDYRRHLCGTLLHRALLAACAKAQRACDV
jgi:carbon-monoxide dehydrogenase medium subunit